MTWFLSYMIIWIRIMVWITDLVKSFRLAFVHIVLAAKNTHYAVFSIILFHQRTTFSLMVDADGDAGIGVSRKYW